MGYLESPSHLIILLVIALLLFGGKRLPEIGRSLGHGMREFKDAVTGNSPSPPTKRSLSFRAQASATDPPATPTPVAAPPERETV